MTAHRAADLPDGSVVYHRGVNIHRQRSGDPPWLGADGKTYTHADIDVLLEGRAFITFVPAGRGRWLNQSR